MECINYFNREIKILRRNGSSYPEDYHDSILKIIDSFAVSHFVHILTSENASAALKKFVENNTRPSPEVDEFLMRMGQAMADHLCALYGVVEEENWDREKREALAKIFKNVLMFKPLSPLTGQDDEWDRCGIHEFQNNRLSSVFKKADGQAYYIDGIVFRDSRGGCYIGKYSFVNVDFPYTPSTVYVDVPEDIDNTWEAFSKYIPKELQFNPPKSLPSHCSPRLKSAILLPHSDVSLESAHVPSAIQKNPPLAALQSEVSKAG
jgi:hypothetical protein